MRRSMCSLKRMLTEQSGTNCKDAQQNMKRALLHKDSYILAHQIRTFAVFTHSTTSICALQSLCESAVSENAHRLYFDQILHTYAC